jgi:Asp-tRNA(Asn)/Glu-tRNA(Gln) amidotransferase A subunit family amidase
MPVTAMGFILTTEAAAAFDELTRSDQDDLLVRQLDSAWPNIFRAARYVPAVEYIQANRLRTLLIEEFHELIRDYDVIITPTFSGTQLLTTNLTGQPVLSIPHGFSEDGTPYSITFLGNLFDEHKILILAQAYQKATLHEDRHPAMFKD